MILSKDDFFLFNENGGFKVENSNESEIKLTLIKAFQKDIYFEY